MRYDIMKTTRKPSDARAFLRKLTQRAVIIPGRFTYMQNCTGTSSKFYAFMTFAHTFDLGDRPRTNIEELEVQGLTCVPFYGSISRFNQMRDFNAWRIASSDFNAWRIASSDPLHGAINISDITRQMLLAILDTQRIGASITIPLETTTRHWLATRGSELVLPLAEHREQRGYEFVNPNNLTGTTRRFMRDINSFVRISNARRFTCTTQPHKVRIVGALTYAGLQSLSISTENEASEAIRSRTQQQPASTEPKPERVPKRRRRGITL
jgi:hypothetical protein